MAASGKKGKKQKGKTLNLSEFLAENDGGIRSGQAVVMAPSKSSWADEMDDEPIYKEKIVLPTAPRAARGADVDESQIPNCPPYTAYIANLPYDIEVEDVSIFFKGLKVKSVRLPRDGGEGGRLRGFGYAEFETRQDLVDALTMSELMIKNRKIRVDIAGGGDGEQGQESGGMGRGRGRPSRNDEEREDRTPNDWRNAPREAPPPGQDRGGPGGFRGDRGGDRGGDRDREPPGGRYEAGFNPRERGPGMGGASERSSFGPRRDGPSSFGRDRDGPSSYGRDRDGPSSYGRDRDGPSSYGRDRDGPSSFGRDRGDGASSFGRDRDGPSSFGRDRDGPSSFGRDRDGPSSFGRDRDGPYGRDREGPSDRAEPPRERQKLSLKPRSVPLDESPAAQPSAPAPVAAEAEPSPSTASSGGGAKAAIFGLAKPVDTAAREREIEERLKERQKEREAPRGREISRPEVKELRDESRGSGRSSDHHSGGSRGRSTDNEKLADRHDYDESRSSERNDRPPRDTDRDYRPPRSNGYRPPRETDRDYRAPRETDRDYRPPRDTDRDYRPPRNSGGDQRPPRDNERGYRSSRDGDHRADEAHSRDSGYPRSAPAAGVYRPPNSRGVHQERSGDQSNGRDNRSHSPESSLSPRVRKLDEPKAPVFENRNKFSFLSAEDENESDGRDD